MDEKSRKLGNRLSGLAMLAFGGVIMTGDSLPFIFFGVAYMVEGSGDLIKGTHHYASTRIIKCLSRGGLDIEYD